MKPTGPGLSVIIPTRNRAALVCDAIESVLAQSHDDLEILVVDDGSEDETAEVVGGFGPPVRRIHQQHRGPAAARNHGLRLARGEFLGFLDDDDLWSAGKLELQMPPLLADAAIDIVLGHTQRMIRDRGRVGENAFVPYRAPVRLYSLGAGLFRRSAFERVGPLDEKMRHAEDDDWFMRAQSLQLRMLFLPAVTLYYRFHDGNMSYDKREKLPDMLRLVKNRLDRIRGGGR